MAEGRRIRRDEADELLAAWERSGERMSDWCAARGLNWFSLNAFQGRLGRRSAEIAFAEVVAPVPMPMPMVSMPAVYRVLVGELEIEVEDDFRDDTLVRLIRTVARC
jgi:hypothetical protein